MEVNDFVVCRTPARICISGPSNSGKTVLTKNLIDYRSRIFSSEVKDILYCYNIYQPMFETIECENPIVRFHQGLPTADVIDDLGKDRRGVLLILDDLCHKAGSSDDVEILMTQKSHHLNISVIYITQNIFDKRKCNRTISLQFDYIFLFRNFRDKGQISCLGRQLFPGHCKSFLSAYDEAVRKPYGYLLINLSASHPYDDIRLFTNIFDDDVVVFKIQ